MLKIATYLKKGPLAVRAFLFDFMHSVFALFYIYIYCLKSNEEKFGDRKLKKTMGTMVEEE